MSIAKGRSFCPACNHELKWFDLIPIFSYLTLKGKCRYCGAKIPLRDTILEGVGGLLSLFCFARYPFQWEALALFVPVIMMGFLHPEMTILDRVLGFFIISLPMYLLTLLIPDCFGGGDIKLIAVCGLLLGWKLTLLAAFIAILMGGAYAVYLMITKKVKKGAYIAFGPYLSVGIVVSLLYGNVIINWYLSLFGLL